MVIVEKGPSYRIERHPEGEKLVVTDWWNDQISRLLADGRVASLDLNYVKGFKSPDLAKLEDWPITKLAVVARTVTDLSPLLRLADTLEDVNLVTSLSAMFDLSRFPRLAGVSAEWGQIRDSVADGPSLRSLFILSYSEPDLWPLRWNTTLTHAYFKDRPRLRSLGGLEVLNKLEVLGVALAPLVDISALAQCEARLTELQLDACRVDEVTPLAGQTGLKLLNVSDCGGIESLSPLRGLHQLEDLWMWGSTKVLDNDLSPLLDLPRLIDLRMQSRRSYRPSVADIQRICEQRT